MGERWLDNDKNHEKILKELGKLLLRKKNEEGSKIKRNDYRKLRPIFEKVW